MSLTARTRGGTVAALLGMAALVSCAKLEKEKAPQIATAGPHAVMVGASVTVTATTANGTDASYTFSSANESIAKVDATGVVTGVGVGETKVKVTGATTSASTTHPVVVVAEDDKAQIPYHDKWITSAHADATARAFTNWDKDGAVPVNCARCHSSEGFIDYLGGDGSAPGQVDRTAPTQSVIRCQTCHDPAASALSSVTFPSGTVVNGLGSEARCMTCHQGRSSGPAVDRAIAAAAPANDDEVSAALNFQNIHYYPAAATLFAGVAQGGYQYAGQVYDVRFRHVEGYDTCVGCHDPHSAKVKFDECATCHTGVTDVKGARAIRMMSSAAQDYDGDANLAEGIGDELLGLRDKLLVAITTYGAEKQTPLCYDEHTHPYWFNDGDGDRACSAAEAVSANGFKSWTARLLRGSYNFQMASKDPGAFAHNAKYIIELLHDSIQDLNSVLIVKVNMARSVRTDVGHFNGASEAARHWDADEQVDASCSACHTGKEGFRFFTQYGVGRVVPETANGLQCGTCHDKLEDKPTGGFSVATVASVTFPSGVIRKEPGNDNLCETCHRGRESKATVDASIAAGRFRFLNVHYLPAGATKLGSATRVGYEYDGKTYAGPLTHFGGTQCTSCHDPIGSKHTFTIADSWATRCANCHADAGGDAHKIRLVHLADYDGDANVAESLSAEIDGLAARVLTAMQVVAPLCYHASTYPYFFKDTNADRQCGTGEAVGTNGFTAFTPPLMKAAFNFQLSRKDPGAWAHNFNYIAQLLYDSVENVGGNVTALTRP